MLENKVAIITGGGSGFGRASSLLFAENGAKVAVVDYNMKTAEETVKMITDDGGEAIAVKADVSNEEDVKKFIDQTVKEYGQLDILFNNAGVYEPGNVEETSLEAWDRSISINLTGAFMGAKYAMPYLKETNGNIINTASAGGIIGFPEATSYGATKGGVISLTQAIAVDYAEEGIRANAICPGTGETGMTNELLKNDQVAKSFLAPIPIKRFGQPNDIAQAALFLASDNASYITGHALPVDGGWTMS